MNQLIELNRSAYHYYITCLPIFTEICQPLFKLGIKFFGYLKLFNDGSHLNLGTDEEFSKIYFSTIKNQGSTSTWGCASE